MINYIKELLFGPAEPQYSVIDEITDRTLITGPYELCVSYARGFGLCYIQKI